MMDPEDMKLPEASNFSVSAHQPVGKIWQILYAVDPARLRKFGPDIIDVIIRDQIEYQIQFTELNMQFEKRQLESLQKIRSRLG
jgi:hypothetical protein